MEQGGNYFNQNFYQNIPNNEVNWAQLAQQWIHQNRPPHPEHGQWQQQYPPRPSGPPRGPPPRYFNPRQPPPPMYNDFYSSPRPFPRQYPPRMNYFNGPPPPPNFHPSMPPRPMGRPPSLFDVRPQWGSHPGPPMMRDQLPPAPLFPSAANTRPTMNNHEQDAYHWPEQSYEPPPPPPPPAWLENNSNNEQADFAALDTNERKKLPAWIREGLEQMEKEKRLREEKEERRKQLEAAERAREEARKAKGKSKFDSDSDNEAEEEEPVRRKFEEYPDRRPMTNSEKEQLINDAVKSVLIELLLESTRKLLSTAAENAFATVKTKRATKGVINKNTAAFAALATLGGSSSEEEDNDGESSEVLKNDDKNGKSGETKVEIHKADGGNLSDTHRNKRSKSRSRSPHSRKSRSRSPKDRHHRRFSRDDYEEDSHGDHGSRYRRFSDASKNGNHHHRAHQSRD